MPTKISIILASRVKGNKNSDIINLIETSCSKAFDKNSFEFLIKFDDDDEDAKIVAEKISKLPVSTNIIVTPRGKGYADLHKAYLDLFMIADKDSEIFWVVSDDMIIESDGWDKLLIDAFNENIGKTFVMHAAKLKNLVNSSVTHAVESVDCYPIWTRKWLCSAGFGYSFSTDGWTGLIEYLLFRDYGIDNRVYVEGIKYRRKIDEEIDGVNAPRWNNERKTMINMISNQNFIKISEETASSVASKIYREGKMLKFDLRSLRHQLIRLFKFRKK